MENYSPFSGFLLVSENSRESAYDHYVPGTPHYVSLNNSQSSEPQLVPSPCSESGSSSTPSTTPTTPVHLNEQWTGYISSIPEYLDARLRVLQSPPESPLRVPSFYIGSPNCASTPVTPCLERRLSVKPASLTKHLDANQSKENKIMIKPGDDFCLNSPIDMTTRLDKRSTDNFKTPDRPQFRLLHRDASYSAPISGRVELNVSSPIVSGKKKLPSFLTPSKVQKNLFAKEHGIAHSISDKTKDGSLSGSESEAEEEHFWSSNNPPTKLNCRSENGRGCKRAHKQNPESTGGSDEIRSSQPGPSSPLASSSNTFRILESGGRAPGLPPSRNGQATLKFKPRRSLTNLSPRH